MDVGPIEFQIVVGAKQETIRTLNRTPNASTIALSLWQKPRRALRETEGLGESVLSVSGQAGSRFT